MVCELLASADLFTSEEQDEASTSVGNARSTCVSVTRRGSLEKRLLKGLSVLKIGHSMCSCHNPQGQK